MTKRRIGLTERKNLRIVDDILRATSRETEQNVVLWRASIRKAVKTGDQAACLCQLLYWYGPGKNGRRRIQVVREFKNWVAKSYGDFGDEIGITAAQARRSLDALAKQRIVERRQFKFGGIKQCHFRIVGATLYELLHQTLGSESEDLADD